jgi:hypothetical protein
VLGEAGLHPIDDGVAFGQIERLRKEFHDCRIGIERGERRSILLSPWPQDQALCL